MLANNFVEINFVLRTLFIDTLPYRNWINSFLMVDIVIQLAARSTAEKTVVRFRILSKEAWGLSLQSHVERIMVESRRAQELYTTGKTWSVGRRVFRGVNL